MSMRYIGVKERNKRGCLYCIDLSKAKKGRVMCPYDRCPYRELDNFSDYEDFVGKTDGIVGLILKAKG